MVKNTFRPGKDNGVVEVLPIYIASSSAGGDGNNGDELDFRPKAVVPTVTVAPGTNTVSTDGPTGDVIVTMNVTGTLQVG